VPLQFYAEANEAETWIREKRPLLTLSDFGKDEDSVQSLAKKLEGVERDLSQFQHTVGKLAKLAQGLVDRGHFDSRNITAKQVACYRVCCTWRR
jgi:spectrin beta